MKKLSIIVPCYNEEEALPYFLPAVEQALAGTQMIPEFIFINDGSSDHTLDVLKKLYAKSPAKIHWLSFSRNFGKEAALYAGLREATGELITVMDADLQDPPEYLPKMYDLIEEGYDVVGTRRTDRTGEPKIRSWFAERFYHLMDKISDTPMVNGVRDYRMMTRQVVDAILELKEYNRFSKGLFSWVGFKTTYLPYKNQERVAGESSWSFWSLFSYSLEAIINFSDFPLILSSFLGILACILAVIFAVVIIIRTILFGDPTSGWPSMVCIILFASGVQLFSLGIVGKYIGKIFLETKHRPIYIVREEQKPVSETQENHEPKSS
ncbi:glycosyltransferase family 2 protein [Enterococcus hirae]|nr:glycosyltransferase family 2 protein [Enterococcaceae bacterium]MCI1919043.1 glycosyltransferase family 2 protein [Enterococcaceae bacterium]MDM8212893.1 glycosyltransferase family 2 protein [Enterococcus hirae]